MVIGMVDFIKKYKIQILFLIFLFLYFLLGMLYNFSYEVNVLNYLFQSDSSRVFNYFINNGFDYGRLFVHPLIIIIVQPINLLLNLLINNKLFTVIIFQSLVGSLQVVLLYKIISKFNKDSNINILISIIFGLCFSNIIFNVGIELYNVAQLGLLLLWYVIAVIIKEKDYNKIVINILLILSGILCFGITITNYMVFLIGCFILLLSRKYNILQLFIINVLIGFLCFVLNIGQGIIFNTESLLSNHTFRQEAQSSWVSYDINISKIKNVILNDYMNSIVSSKVINNVYDGSYYENGNLIPEKYYYLSFDKNNIFNIIVMISFMLLILYFIIVNIKKDTLYKVGLLLALLFNSIFHLIYGNNDSFLYSQHFIYLIFILLGISCNKKINIYLLLFMLYEFVINILSFSNILSITNDVFNKSSFGNVYLLIRLLIIIILFIILVGSIILIIRFIKSKKYIYSIIMIIFIILVFIVFNKILVSDRLSNYKVININKDSVINFVNVYDNEIESYNNYLDEYEMLVNNTNSELIYIGDSFYLFGMGNRTKFIYSNGNLINIEDNSVIKHYEIIDELIIPNINTVLLYLSDYSYIKIYEDCNGIYINDELIVGTDSYIDLYDFSNYKYSNILNVLYSEILFNIKDGMFIPNIMVYDNVWYRDAAMGAMVLEKTNNISLISDWINSINNIYDKQNGSNEADNLGELLYLISLTNNNDKLKNKIIKEVELLASNNSNGYFVDGLVDMGNRPYYINNWIKFGYEKNDLEYNFDNVDIDNYSGILWFSNSCQSVSDNFVHPYLYWGMYHCNHDSKVRLNINPYPLSWEDNASSANYDNISDYLISYKNGKVSPTHVWSAAEMFLALIEE